MPQTIEGIQAPFLRKQRRIYRKGESSKNSNYLIRKEVSPWESSNKHSKKLEAKVSILFKFHKKRELSTEMAKIVSQIGMECENPRNKVFNSSQPFCGIPTYQWCHLF
jgi:hypothetical protein